MYTIYSKDLCPNCDKTKMILFSKGLEFEVKKLDVDFDIKWFMKEFKSRTFPVIVHDDTVYKGFEELYSSL